MRVVFFGNSVSAFSNGLFDALSRTKVRTVGIVDVPKVRSFTTVKKSVKEVRDFVQSGREMETTCFRPDSPNSERFILQCKNLRPHLFLAAGYTQIFKDKILSVPSLAAVNVHASLLPKYRGKHPVFWAIRNREQYTGLTVHHITQGIDEGAIILQKKVKVKPQDTVSSLYSRIIKEGFLSIRDLIKLCQSGSLPRQPQPVEKVSYYSSIKLSGYQVNWQEKAQDIEALVRAAEGKCYMETSAGRVYLEKVEIYTKGQKDIHPGQVELILPQLALVKAKDGLVKIDKIHWKDDTMSFYDFCSQNRISSGDIL